MGSIPGGRAAVRPLAPFRFTPHLERFTLPGEASPWLYGPPGRLHMLLPGPGGLLPASLEISGEPLSPVVTVESPRPGLAAGLVAEVVRAGLDWGVFQRRLGEAGLEALAPEGLVGLRPGRCLSLYNALVDSIVKQRLPLRAALRLLARLVQRLGPRVVWRGRVYTGYPRPGRLAGASVEELRLLGLSRVKARGLVEVARAELEGRLPSAEDAARDPVGVARELEGLYGVGPWTAGLAVAMVHPLFPVGPRGDLAVERGLRLALGRPVRPREVLEALGEWAGLALYLAAFLYEDLRRR